MSERHTGDLAEWIQEDGPAVGRPGQHPVAVLSAAMLRTARARCQESQAEFAARAGVALDVVQGAEDGTCPAWALPYADFTALADAVAAWWPWPAFETAAGCDLLLSCILNGDQVLATDVLAEDGTRELARSLLRWAVTGDVQAHGRRRVKGRCRQAARRCAAGTPAGQVGGPGGIGLGGRVGWRRAAPAPVRCVMSAVPATSGGTAGDAQVVCQGCGVSWPCPGCGGCECDCSCWNPFTWARYRACVASPVTDLPPGGPADDARGSR